MNSDINPYSLFGLSESFTKKELQTAYYEMALITHPDRGGSKEEMHTVIKAYEYLKSVLNLGQSETKTESYEENIKELDSLTIPSFMDIYEEAHDQFIQKFNQSFDDSEGLLSTPGYEKYMVTNDTDELCPFPTRELTIYDGSQNHSINTPIATIDQTTIDDDLSIAISDLCLSDYRAGFSSENIPDIDDKMEMEDVTVLFEKELLQRDIGLFSS